jgi:hypothetical protein
MLRELKGTSQNGWQSSRRKGSWKDGEQEEDNRGQKGWEQQIEKGREEEEFC